MDSKLSVNSKASPKSSPKKVILKVRKLKRKNRSKPKKKTKPKSFRDWDQNRAIADQLERFARAHKLLGSHFRSRAYTKALQALEVHVRFPITSGDSVNGIDNVGIKIKTKIDKFLTTGSIPALLELEANPKLHAYESLTKIHGVGYVKAKSWIKAGIHSIEELKQAVLEGHAKLTKAQKIGLEHYDDLQTRITQNEMDYHRDLLSELIQSASTDGTEFGITIAGSYRRFRGLPDDQRHTKLSGDVDVLITHPSVKTKADMDTAPFLARIAKVIEKSGYSLGRLTSGKTKYSAVIALPEAYVGERAKAGFSPLLPLPVESGKARHLDIRLFPLDTFVFSLFHFTGSGTHNMLLRARALEKGYSLSEYGLVSKTKGQIEGLTTEAEIYAELGEPYVPPHER